jgi:hypothetical protein
MLFTVPAIKDDNGSWEIKGHPLRVIHVDTSTLRIMHQIRGAQEAERAVPCLVSVHSRGILSAMAALCGNLKADFQTTKLNYFEGLDEATCLMQGHLEKLTAFPNRNDMVILSGPHFHIANPNYQSPKAVYDNHRSYSSLDLSVIPVDYSPRTNFKETETTESHLRDKLGNQYETVSNAYRLCASRSIDPVGERTLQSCIIPPKVFHIDSCVSLTFANDEELILTAAAWASILYDFFVKVIGKSDFRQDIISALPALKIQHRAELLARYLALNSITDSYTHLWQNNWHDGYQKCEWSKKDHRLPNSHWQNLSCSWDRGFSLRTPFSRRQAMLEIDVLIAMELGVTLEVLKEVWRIQFPVSTQYEKDTWYDQVGNIAFTTSRGLPGVGLKRRRWEEVSRMTGGTVEHTVTDDIQPGGPHERTIVYHAPFDRCDREKDYEIAWAEFERRFGKSGASAQPDADATPALAGAGE